MQSYATTRHVGPVSAGLAMPHHNYAQFGRNTRSITQRHTENAGTNRIPATDLHKKSSVLQSNPPRPRPAPMAKTRKRILSRHPIASPARTPRNSNPLREPPRHPSAKMQERTESQPPTCTKNRAYYKANPPQSCPTPMAKTGKRTLSRHPIPSPARTPRNSNPLREAPRHPNAKMQEQTESQPPARTENRAYYKANPPPTAPPIPLTKTQE